MKILPNTLAGRQFKNWNIDIIYYIGNYIPESKSHEIYWYGLISRERYSGIFHLSYIKRKIKDKDWELI